MKVSKILESRGFTFSNLSDLYDELGLNVMSKSNQTGTACQLVFLLLITRVCHLFT